MLSGKLSHKRVQSESSIFNYPYSSKYYLTLIGSKGTENNSFKYSYISSFLIREFSLSISLTFY